MGLHNEPFGSWPDDRPLHRGGSHSIFTSYPTNYDTAEKLLRATGRDTVRVVRRWTVALDGSTCSVAEIGFYDDRAEIERRVLERSKQEGWTPKRWWQFWRWDDTPNPEAPPHG